MIRAVLDTNILVSAILSPQGASFRIVATFLSGRMAVVTSEPLLAELQDVLCRPRIKRRHGWSRVEIDSFVAGIRSHGETVAVTGTVRLCRDAKDDIVIETAPVGRADLLVSGDEDFLGSPAAVEALARAGIHIVTPAQLAAALALEPPPDPLSGP